jgi:acetyl-CoA acetyltransferase family protein
MNKNAQLVIIDGLRTPFSKMGTDLAALDAVEIGRQTVTALLTRTGIDPAIIDEVILGNVAQPGDAANIARVIALRSQIPRSVPAYTAGKAAAGQGEIFLVGGVESMSHIPMLYHNNTTAKFSKLTRAKSLGQKLKAITAFRPRDFSPVVGLKIGLTDQVVGMNMGDTAEIIAREFKISRDEQDAFALRSHEKATAARERLAEEIVPTYSSSAKDGVAEMDNGVREQQTMEALGKLRPVFERNTGTVTAGNSSQITDGAGMMLVMSEAKASEHGLEPLGRLVDFHYSGCDPERMGLGPAHAMEAIAKRQGFNPDQANVIEINEAFAAQVIGAKRLFESMGVGSIPDELLNPNGGAIALGHPVGASGARLVITALKELQRRGGKRAYVSLCIGGGQGVAALLERL